MLETGLIKNNLGDGVVVKQIKLVPEMLTSHMGAFASPGSSIPAKCLQICLGKATEKAKSWVPATPWEIPKTFLAPGFDLTQF